MKVKNKECKLTIGCPTCASREEREANRKKKLLQKKK